MRIIVAPDSFKGSLSASEICDIVERSANQIFPNCEVLKMPVADGGEGTVESLLCALKGDEVSVTVKGPMGAEVNAQYGIFNGNSAVMEMAAASGLPLVAYDERNIRRACTFGTGQMIIDAIERGCTTIYMGLGGSATNDAGLGCAAALGAKFFDVNGDEISPLPENFAKITKVDVSAMHAKLANTKLVLMSDVKNPLLGQTGATAVYGKQKGANAEDEIFLEQGIAHVIALCEGATGKDVKNLPGAGAAGGLGAGLLAFTNASIQSGVETVLDMLDFEKALDGTNLVITGEGRMDYQSAFGKVAFGVGSLCKKANVPCIAIVGGLGERAEEMFEHGITSIITTVNGVMDLPCAVKNAPELCYSASVRLLRMVKAGMDMAKN